MKAQAFVEKILGMIAEGKLSPDADVWVSTEDSGGRYPAYADTPVIGMELDPTANRLWIEGLA